MGIPLQVGKLDIDNLDCDPNRTQLFRINVEYSYPKIKGLYSTLLSKKELIRAERFYHLRDQKNFLVRRCYLRLTLSRLMGLAPTQLDFQTKANKKPFVHGQEFSTSHSGEYAVIAVGPGPIGVDIEWIDGALDFSSIADACYSEAERMYLNSPQEPSKFYGLWTRKEALLKASGEGIVDDLRTINCLKDRVARNGIDYTLTTFAPGGDYVISLATSADAKEVACWDLDC